MKTDKSPKGRQPQPEALKIEGAWTEAVTAALTKKRPAAGWPERPVKKRRKRKKES